MLGTGAARARLKDLWRDPVAWTEAIQVVKTVVAAVAAWIIATRVFHLPQAFLAPWSALLVVHATVYRTLSEGVQQVAATVVGVTLAWATGNLLGLDPLAIAVMLLASLAIGKLTGLLDGTTVAATAVIVLTIGYSDDHELLVFRFLDTAIGIAVGIFVNLLVWPPLRDYSAARAIDSVDEQVGHLLRGIAGQLREDCAEDEAEEWVVRTREIDEALSEAWSLLRQASESGRLNPRRGAGQVKQPGQFSDLLQRAGQAVAEIRSMARTLGHSISAVNAWGGEFRSRWIELLDEAGAAIEEADSQRMTQVRLRLQQLARDLSTDELSSAHWPEYGGLILNLRNIVAAMGPVTESTPATGAAISVRRPTLRR